MSTTTPALPRRRIARAHRLLTAVTVSVLAAAILCAFLGVISGRTAVMWVCVAEGVVAVVMVIVGVVRFVPVIRGARHRGAPLGQALVDEEPLLAFVLLEIRCYAALWRVARRRPRVPAGVQGFGYLRGTLAIPLAFLFAAVVEMIVVHLLLPWPVARIVALVFEVWGVLLVVGVLAGRAVNPHLLGPDRLVLRWGYDDIVHVPVSTIGAVRRCSAPDRTQTILENGSLTLAFFEPSNVQVEFTEEVPAQLHTGFRGGTVPQAVRRAFLYVSDPEGFVAAAQAVMGERDNVVDDLVEEVR